MFSLTFKIIIFYLFFFSFPTLVDIFLSDSATLLEFFLILILWLYTWIIVRKKISKKEKKIPDFLLTILLFCIGFSGLISFLVREIPLTVVIYRSMPLVSFYPLVYLIIYLKRKYKLLKKVLIFTIILCNVISVGIIYDSLGGLVQTPLIGEKIVSLEKESGTLKNRLRGGQRRGSFFLGGSTSVYPFLSLGILCSLVLYKIEGEKRKYLWSSLPNLVMVCLGCFFSLSRAPLLLAITFSFYSILKIFVFSQRKIIERRILFTLLGLTILIITPIIQSQIYQQINEKAVNIVESGISAQDRSNYKRYLAWHKGLLLFTDTDAWIGYGLGTSNLAVKNNKLLNYSQYRYHYESSIFSTFSEGGILGIIVIFMPFIIIVWISRHNPDRDIYICWAILLLTNLFVAPILGNTSQFAYFLGMSLCVALKPVKYRISEVSLQHISYLDQLHKQN
ncbi:MAG: hypothetical protein Kow0049_27900 [Stanieria sp.]